MAIAIIHAVVYTMLIYCIHKLIMKHATPMFVLCNNIKITIII